MVISLAFLFAIASLVVAIVAIVQVLPPGQVENVLSQLKSLNQTIDNAAYGNPGGVLSFLPNGTAISSNPLAANQIVLGGGVDNPPVSLASGSTGSVLTMNAGTPVWTSPCTRNILQTNSQTKTVNGSGQYAQMIKNMLEIPPGTWFIFGTIIFASYSDAQYTTSTAGFFLSNGFDNATAPVFMTPNAIGGQSIIQLFAASAGSTTKDVAVSVSMVYIVSGSNSTVYLVPYQESGTPASVYMIASMTAFQLG